MIGRCGKRKCSSAAKKGCAAPLIPAQDNTPPFSKRRARDCTAGVSETLANNSLVAAISKSCAKLAEVRRDLEARQGSSKRLTQELDRRNRAIPATAGLAVGGVRPSSGAAMS